MSVSETQLFIYPVYTNNIFNLEKKICFSVNYVINDLFMIQYDPADGFSIPSSETAKWCDSKIQDLASESLDADELAKKLNLQTSLDVIYELSLKSNIFGDDETAESTND